MSAPLDGGVGRRVGWLAVLLVGAIAVCGCARKPSNASEERRPNILLLVADDLGLSFVGAYGNELAPTPHIDRLAREGMRFTGAFTPTALCRPSRWAMYTGLYPHASGVDGFDRVPRDIPLLHEILGAHGYRTGLLAKFGSRVQDFRPFDFFVGNPELADGTDIQGIAAAARRFLQETGDRPFYLQIGFGDPHTPYPTQPYCPPDQVPIPAYLPDLPEVRTSIARYYAAVDRLDQGVGLVLEELERAGHGLDTLVLFTSDHGPAFPFAKSTLYDAAVAVPLIARWPGHVAPAAVTHELISFVDVRPTLLRAAGIETDGKQQGRSFLPLLVGEPFEARDAVLLSHTANWEGTYPMRAVRTARYKYIRNFHAESEFRARLELQPVWRAMEQAARNDPTIAARVRFHGRHPPEELYVLDADPAELDNRIEDPDLGSELERLRERLRVLMRESDDPLLE